MGLKTDQIMSDTRDLPTYTEARKGLSVVLKPAAIPQKRKYRSASSFPRYSPMMSSVDDVVNMLTDTEVAASQQVTAPVDVVASMHSYAMPGCIRRSTTGHTTTGLMSYDDENRASNNESSAADTVKRPVSLCLCIVTDSVTGRNLFSEVTLFATSE